MPRVQILPSAQPHPFAGQNAAAFKKLFEVLGEGETMRRKKMLNTDILGILQGGGDPEKTPMENIAITVQRHQQPTYSPGLPGLLQRIAGQFAEPPGAGITEALTKGTLESAFKTISPSQMMAGERWRKYQEAVASGDEETAKRLLSSALVNFNVPTGQKLLTAKQRQELADKGFAEEMGMSEAQRNTARKSVKTIISEMGTRTWTWGTKNYARGNLIQGYKQYRTENTYANKTADHRKWLDKNWDDQMTTYNKAGYKDIGKGEFDWDLKDPKVQALRKEALEQSPTKTLTEPEVRALLSEVGGDVQKARELAKQRGWIIPK